MKMVQNIILTLVTVLTFTLSSCNPASVPTVTPDEIPVVATADEAQTEPTTIIEETTAAVTEETTVPETTAPDVTEPTEVKEPEKTENKPVNNNSSDKQQNNTNNNTQNTNKPSNNNGSQTTNKPNNNSTSNNNSNTNSKPAEQKPVVVTDDTIIPYEQICTDTNMAKVTDSVNAYFIAKGMRYDTSVNKDNSGWFFVQMPMLQYDELSVNKLKYMVTDYFDSEVEANLLSEQLYSDGTTEYYYTNLPSDYKINCHYELTSGGYYNIYFAYR